ncbi:hypothetical protein IAT38_006376 [Cryptococcus sp. DSM 104549]
MFAKLFTALLAASAVLAAPLDGQVLDKRITHTGRATFYTVDGSTGACGWDNTDSDYVVALNRPQYKANSGTNCGQWVVITNTQNGRTANAYVADECPECKDGSLDMSPALFGDLNDGDYDAGVFPISWHFKKRT